MPLHDLVIILLCWSVWTLFFLETVFTVFVTIAAWNMFGSHWGDTEAILILDWSWTPLPPLSSFSEQSLLTFSDLNRRLDMEWAVWHRHSMHGAYIASLGASGYP